MKTFYQNLWKIIPVFLAAVFMTTVGYALPSHGLKGDITAEATMKSGAEIMISAEHLLMASLEKLDVTKEAAISKGVTTLTEGEKMILDGKKMMQHAATRIKGKEMMMKGSSRMMEGKDFIMNELKEGGTLHSSVVKEDEQELTKSENVMLEGKNMMMDGEKNFK